MYGVVPDANTLIYLAKSEMLNLLNHYKVNVTEQVYEEAVQKGKENNKTDAYLLEKHIENNWQIEPVEKTRLENQMKYFGAKGETSVYLKAKQKEMPAVTSDKAARNKMKKKQIKVIRTDMLLLKQFQNNKISKKSLREKLNRLNTVGGTTGQRINFLIKKAEQTQQEDQE